MAIKSLNDYIRDNEINMNQKFTGKQIQDITWTKKQKQSLTRYQPKKKEKKGNFITRSIATVDDIVTDILKAPVKLGREGGKLIAGGIAQTADWLGADEFASKVRKNISDPNSKANKLLDDIDLIGKANKATDKYTYLSDKLDFIPESIGDILTFGAAGTVNGVLGAASMFAPSAGEALGESYAKGGNDVQSWTKAIGAGGISVATESLFGIFGKSGLDTAIANKLSSKFTSGAAKILARQGIQATSEATEEFLEYAGNQLLDKAIDGLSKGKGAKFYEKWDWEQVGEQMAGAFISSSIFGAGQTALNIKDVKSDTKSSVKESVNEYAKQIDVSEEVLSKKEQDVAKKLTRDRVRELIDSGNEPTAKEIKKIQRNVEQNIKDGDIRISDIENTLRYKDYVQREIQNAENEKGRKLTREEYNEANKKASDLFQNNIKDSGFLQNAYTQERLKGQNFNYETNENDDNYKKGVYESAKQYLNDTEKAHKLADTMAKLSSDKQTTYEFINNEGLKKLGLNVEGMTVNGTQIDNPDGTKKVYINVDSNENLKGIVGHETTHVLEGTEEYKEFKDALFNYAIEKGDYYDKKNAITQLYKDVKNVNVESELLADLTGEYLFQDDEFIKNLSVEKPTLFQRIKNMIDDLVIRFKGTKEERLLREAQRKFEKAYRTETAKNVSVKSKQNIQEKTQQALQEQQEKIKPKEKQEIKQKEDIQYSISKDSQGRELSKQQQEYFKDSKVRDENGNLMEVYHGTPSDFTIFDKEKIGTNTNNEGLFGKGFYFTNKENLAEGYSKYHEGDNHVKKGYLNITNPFVWKNIKTEEQMNQFIEDNNIPEGTIKWNPYEQEIHTITEVENERAFSKALQDAGYDGIIYEYRQQDENHKAVQEIVAFESNQFKNVDNTNPTDSPDIRYSLSNKNDGYTEEQREDIEKWKSKYIGMNNEKLDKEYDYANESYQEMKESAYKLEKEYKEFQKTDDFIKTLQNYDFDSETQKKATEYADKIRYYNREANKYFAQREAINEIMMGNVEDTRSVEQIVKDAEEHFGTTMNFKEAAYITLNGNALDFSGKNEGGTPGRRSLDHRQINEIDTTMDDFIKQGNIRLKPEGNGFEVYTMPNDEQISKLYDYINQADGELFVDIIKDNDTYDAMTYRPGTSARTIINDLQTYFKTGKFPEKSQYADFYYSLSREGQNVDRQPGGIYSEDISYQPRTEEFNKVVDYLPIKQGKPLKLSKNEQKQANKIKEEYLPLTKNNDVLRVDAENIAKEINKTGDFDTTKQRKWIQNLKNSDAIQDKSILKDLDMSKLSYEVQTNQKSLDRANDYIENNGYDNSLNHVKDLIRSEKTPTATDVALLQRMTQEAIKNKDYQTAQELIMDTAILGTDLGQAVQAMSIIQKLTPEGQLKLYTKMINRAKIRGEKAFTDVEITPNMVETVLGAYNEDGTYDQDDLTARVEKFKQDVATQMKSTVGDKVNAWRYLSMLGNPKTHIRNVVSNVAMKGTIKVKNTLARTLETVLPIKERTKTFERASKEIKNYAKETAAEMKGIITGENKYNEKVALEQEKQIFKNKALEGISRFNSAALEAEDWFFSRSAFESNLSEYLTANGVKSMEDVKNNPEIVEKAKIYAVEQAEIATFRQYSKLASEISRIERNGKLSKYALNAVLPFKKTPINVAKAGFNYSPLGLIKNISYDAYQLKQGNINGSQFVDNISQGLTGTSVAILGYALAKAGILSGGGDDDKEGKYDSQLGKQSYALNIGGKTYSISWLSPTGMPLLVGANLYEKLEEDKDWSFDVVADTLANTLDPMSEMSFLSSLTDVLKSYNTGGTQMIKSMAEAGTQSYILQFFPTLFGQLASTLDDTKRSTKASNNSNWKFGEETIRKIMLKVPGLRNQLEEQTDIWGNAKQQTNNIITRAVENFIAPYSKTEDITSDIDKEIKRVFNQTGETSVIPGIPQAYVKKDDETFKMSASEYTKYKQTFGQTANRTMNELFNSSSYKEVDDTEKAKMIENVYKYAREQAKQEYFNNIKEDYNNKETSKVEKIQEDYGITAGDYYANKDEYSYAEKNPEKYLTISQVGNYKDYNEYKSEINRIKQEYDNTNDRKQAVFEYINSLPLNVEQKLILQKTAANYSIKQYRGRLQDYIESLDLSADEKQAIDKVLFD